jgi:hypothetical protein
MGEDLHDLDPGGVRWPSREEEDGVTGGIIV